jgi:hypothetical protein
VLGEFASTRAFHQFVLEGNEKAIVEFYRKRRQGPVLGEEHFRDRLGKPARVSREHPRYERTFLRPSPDTVLKVLAELYSVDVEALVTAKRGRHNEARQVGMYLIKELCDLKLQEIADRFGTITYGAVGWACHGVALRMQSDSKFRRRLDGIRRDCQQKT